MSESPDNDFQGGLQASIKHILDAEDTSEDLKVKLQYAEATLKENTSGLLNDLRENLKLDEEHELILRDSTDARRELSMEIGSRLKDDALSYDDLLESLTKVLDEELIESIMKVEDLDSLPVSQLREMEKETPGILLFAFTSWGARHEGLDVAMLGNDYLPVDGDFFTVDFRGNDEAYWAIGAADLLPPEARGMKMESPDGTVRTSTHRAGLKGEKRGGFYDNEGYMPIFDDDVITIVEVDMSIRDDYFNEETGEWDTAAYEKEHAEEDEAYLMVPSSIGDDGSVGRKTAELNQYGYSLSLENIREDNTEWFNAAETASVLFSNRLDVTIPVSSTFAVIAKESNFNPNAVSSSGCTGLGQFGKAAWTDFFKQNESIAREVLSSQGIEFPRNRAAKMRLRTNALLNIYATTWYLGKIAKSIGKSRVDSGTMHEIYLCYHEGVGGKRALQRFIETGRGRIYPWQKNNPRQYWKSINSYAGQVASQTERYEGGTGQV